MNKVSTAWWTIATAIWVSVVYVVVFFMLVFIVGGRTSAGDINKACVKHQGVRQVQSHLSSYPVNGNANVVCIDGTFKTVGD